MRDSKRKFDIRKVRIRTKIAKVSARLRLSVFKSGRHLYAQIIDDINAITIVSASTLDKDIRKTKKSNNNKEAALRVGELVGQRAVALGLKEVVFDKGGYKYHGVIKALSDGARKNLEF